MVRLQSSQGLDGPDRRGGGRRGGPRDAVWWVAVLIFRWRFQFGIRSVLVFCLASRLLPGWLAVEMKEARRQAERSSGYESSGSRLFDLRLGNRPRMAINCQSHPPGPEWLRNLLGVDLFSEVVRVSLYDTWIKDDGLDHLKSLGHLNELNLSNTQVTDAGMKYIENLSQLKVLGVIGTRVTDAGMEHLKGLRELQSLGLAETTLTDAGLMHIKGLTQLKRLFLDDTHVTDAGLEQLDGLRRLEMLGLGGTNVTDAGLETLPA